MQSLRESKFTCQSEMFQLVFCKWDPRTSSTSGNF